MCRVLVAWRTDGEMKEATQRWLWSEIVPADQLWCNLECFNTPRLGDDSNKNVKSTVSSQVLQNNTREKLSWVSPCLLQDTSGFGWPCAMHSITVGRPSMTVAFWGGATIATRFRDSAGPLNNRTHDHSHSSWGQTVFSFLHKDLWDAFWWELRLIDWFILQITKSLETGYFKSVSRTRNSTLPALCPLNHS